MQIRRAQHAVVSIAATIALSGALVGCSGDSNDGDTTPPSSAASQDSSPTPNDDASSPEESSAPEGSPSGGDESETDVNNIDLADHAFDLTYQDALDRAKDEFDGDVSKIELEVEGRVYAYKIELLSDTEEFEYEIDANTGDVLDQETDSLDQDETKTERKNKRIDLDKVISVSDAMDIARDKIDGRVKEWKIEGKSSGPQYEFDIEKPGSTDDVEVKIDALSGDVLEVDG